MAFAACGDTDVIVDVDPTELPSFADADLQLVQGTSLEGEVASMLPQPLVVEVRDDYGSPLEGAPLEWVFSDGLGATAGSAVLSDTVRTTTAADGRATVRWQLGTRAGTQDASVEIDVPVPWLAASTGANPGDAKRAKIALRARARAAAPDSVAIEPEVAALTAGDSVTLDARAIDQFGNVVDGASVEWASSDTVVARVDTTGLLTAVSPGEATITATAADATGQETVIVQDSGELQVDRVVASPDTVVLHAGGDTARISVVAENPFGEPVNGITFEFSSSDSTIVRVDSMGQLVSRAAGVAMIAVSAICCGADDSVIVQVNDATDTLSIHVVDEDSVVVETLHLEIGDSAWLEATAFNALGHPTGDVQAQWESSNPTVASVSEVGVVKALSAGSAVVSASYDGVVATVPTEVVDPNAPPPPPPPPPGAVVFHSDWSTATGAGAAAILNQGGATPWQGIQFGIPPFMEVIPDPYDFPTDNVLEIEQNDFGLIYTPQLPSLDNNGDAQYWRVYMRVTIPANGTNDATHGLYDGEITGYDTRNMGFDLEQSPASGKWNISWNFSNSPSVNPSDGIYGSTTPLNLNQTYRVEWGYQRVSSTSFKAFARVYDIDGNPVLDESDFRSRWGSGNTLADGFVFRTNSPLGINASRRFIFGLNGLLGVVFGQPYAVYGAVAICRDTWCGPYPIEGVEN